MTDDTAILDKNATLPTLLARYHYLNLKAHSAFCYGELVLADAYYQDAFRISLEMLRRFGALGEVMHFSVEACLNCSEFCQWEEDSHQSNFLESTIVLLHEIINGEFDNSHKQKAMSAYVDLTYIASRLHGETHSRKAKSLVNEFRTLWPTYSKTLVSFQ
ncbi:MAG: hypothetical protein VX148_15000 [Pseudomonadota bacterium]|nr:hypothetical protein [Pseudomonadota bacterium]